MQDSHTRARGGVEQAIQLAHHLQQNIAFVSQNAHDNRYIEFCTRGLDGIAYPTTLFVWHIQNHFHAITNIKGFFGCSYYCEKCNVRSNDKYVHRCPDATDCRMCGREPEAHDNDGAPLECMRCFRSLVDRDCFAGHITRSICSKSWWCVDCDRTYPYTRTKHEHVCFESFCKQYGEWQVGSHECWIQPKEAKPPLADGSLRYFDFESETGNGIHVPNMCVASNDLENYTVYKRDGDSIIQLFIEREISRERAGTTLMAHNSRAYDSQLIKEGLWNAGIHFETIQSGRKLLLLSIPKLNIRIIDFCSFVTAPLSKLPKMFGLRNLAKGFFPHELNKKENWGKDLAFNDLPMNVFLPQGSHDVPYRVGEENEWEDNSNGDNPNEALFDKQDEVEGKQERPQKKQKLDKHAREDDRVALMAARLCNIRWVRSMIAGGKKLKIPEDLETYNIQDVNVLGTSGAAFRSEFERGIRTDRWDESKAERGVDPFSYITISSACMAAYRHKFLEPNTLAHFKHTVDQHSLESIRFLEYTARAEHIHIKHARNGGEATIQGYKVDGFCAHTNTVYEFSGCYHHGHPECFPNESRKYDFQVSKENAIRAAGFTLVSMWECEWRKLKKKHGPVRTFFEENPVLWETPIEVRDAFFGGRTNALRLHFKAPPGVVAEYYDVNGMYSYINKHAEYMVGQREIILHPSLETLSKVSYRPYCVCAPQYSEQKLSLHRSCREIQIF